MLLGAVAPVIGVGMNVVLGFLSSLQLGHRFVSLSIPSFTFPIPAPPARAGFRSTNSDPRVRAPALVPDRTALLPGIDAPGVLCLAHGDLLTARHS